MLREKEYAQTGYYLKYAEIEEGLTITGFNGRVLSAQVPAYIEEKPVIKIEKKAFLSKKTLREIKLPPTIREIGDWAFAYCSNLERITLPGTEVAAGKAVFLNCPNLAEICSCEGAGKLDGAGMQKKFPASQGDTGWSSEVGHLLAAAVTVLDAYYLLDTQTAGSAEWLRKWDSRLFAVMEEEDLEGYQKQVLCGEEDYGSTDMGAFLQGKRMKKVRLAFLRLQNPQGLSRENRTRLVQYLTDHTKGKESEETWQVLLQEYHHDYDKINLFLETGCADLHNLQGILHDIGEEFPEMKAIFLRYKDSAIGYQDFFADLENID